jgi:hypothetical protein
LLAGASCLEAIADSVAERSSVEDKIQLAMTGPEGRAYHPNTAVVVQDLFRRAELSVLVAGFAFYQGKDVFADLGQRMDELSELHVRVFVNVPRKHEDTGTTAEIVSGFVQKFKSYNWLPEPYYRLPHAYRSGCPSCATREVHCGRWMGDLHFLGEFHGCRPAPKN